MNDYSLGRLYEILKGDLMEWIGRNPKTKFNITPHNLTYLFEFHRRNGLSIDLSRFDKEYYYATFYPPEAKQEVVTEFLRKATTVIQNSLKRIGKEELNLTITIRHKVSEVSYWHSCYFGEFFDPKTMSLATRKENDWL